MVERQPRSAPATAVRAPAPVQRRAAERRPRRSPLRWIILALIVLLAGIGVALALTLGNGNRETINRGNVDDQVRDLIHYVRDHTK